MHCFGSFLAGSYGFNDCLGTGYDVTGGKYAFSGRMTLFIRYQQASLVSLKTFGSGGESVHGSMYPFLRSQACSHL